MSFIIAKLHWIRINVNGSDTVEKLGTIVCAFVILCMGLLAIDTMYKGNEGIVAQGFFYVKQKFDAVFATIRVIGGEDG